MMRIGTSGPLDRCCDLVVMHEWWDSRVVDCPRFQSRRVCAEVQFQGEFQDEIQDPAHLFGHIWREVVVSDRGSPRLTVNLQPLTGAIGG